MMCYRDRTFCTCDDPKCDRYLSPEEAKKAERLGMLVSVQDFHADAKVIEKW